MTRCTVCREEMLIQREVAAVGHTEPCPHCGTPALIVVLIDAARTAQGDD